jgi:hypothetical protein
VGLLSAAWFTGLIGPDPRLSEIRDLQAKLADPSLPEQDRRAAFGEMRKKMGELPEDLRQKMRQGGGPPGMGPGMGLKHMKDVLAMSDADRNAALDKEIKADLDGMKRFEDMAKQAQSAGGGATPNGPGGGPRGPGGPGGAPNQWRNRWLSQTPADQRATMGVYRQLKQARATQTGTPLPQWGPR